MRAAGSSAEVNRWNWINEGYGERGTEYRTSYWFSANKKSRVFLKFAFLGDSPTSAKQSQSGRGSARTDVMDQDGAARCNAAPCTLRPAPFSSLLSVVERFVWREVQQKSAPPLPVKIGQWGITELQISRRHIRNPAVIVCRVRYALCKICCKFTRKNLTTDPSLIYNTCSKRTPTKSHKNIFRSPLSDNFCISTVNYGQPY